MRVAMFGGSFNPIHNGHIEIIRAVKEKFNLDKVLFVVANDPPHKEIQGHVPAKMRFEMVKLALNGIPGMEESDLELQREGKSYTMLTVDALKRQYPGDELFLIVGADMLLTLDAWNSAQRLMQSIHVIAIDRPLVPGTDEAARRLNREYGANIALCGITGPALSSTEIREALFRAEPITGLVPDRVERFLYENTLYMPEQIADIASQLKRKIGMERVLHTAGVMCTAAGLACRYGVDAQKARLAALLHDCAKVSKEEQRRLAGFYGMDTNRYAPAVIHGPLGARRARDEYGIMDEAVLQAIAVHTVCRAGMSDLDKVIYLADKIEPGRDYQGVEQIRAAAEISLDRGTLACIEYTMQYLKEKGQVADPGTYAAREELINKIQEVTIWNRQHASMS